MSIKPVIPRLLARGDIDEAVDYYLSIASENVALDFIASMERAFRHIARFPGAGSLRYAYELDLPNLRVWPLRHFPHLVFYIERDDHLDVWRVLHGERDMPAWLREPDNT